MSPFRRLTHVFALAFCATVIYVGFRRVKKMTQPPPFNERVSKQLRGLCYTTNGVINHMTPELLPGVATVVWESPLRLSHFLQNIATASHSEEIPWIFLTIRKHSLKQYNRSAVLDCGHCTESVLGDLFLSRDIKQVHFLYDVDGQWDNGDISTALSNDLFKCHTTFLQVLAKRFHSSFEAFFHLSDPMKYSHTEAVPSEEQNPEAAHNCTVTLRFNVENSKQVAIRILEMIAYVFHNLYGFKYYYVF